MGVQILFTPHAQAVVEKSQPLPLSENFQKKEQTQHCPILPERTLSLRACITKAYESNKELIAAKYNLPIAKADIQIAGAIPNPQFSFLYGFGPAFRIILAGNPQQFGWQETVLTAGKR